MGVGATTWWRRRSRTQKRARTRRGPRARDHVRRRRALLENRCTESCVGASLNSSPSHRAPRVCIAQRLLASPPRVGLRRDRLRRGSCAKHSANGCSLPPSRAPPTPRDIAEAPGAAGEISRHFGRVLLRVGLLLRAKRQRPRRSTVRCLGPSAVAHVPALCGRRLHKVWNLSLFRTWTHT